MQTTTKNSLTKRTGSTKGCVCRALTRQQPFRTFCMRVAEKQASVISTTGNTLTLISMPTRRKRGYNTKLVEAYIPKTTNTIEHQKTTHA